MKKVNMFGVQFDPLTMDEAVTAVLSMAKSRSEQCRYVVTPNLDHVVKLQEDKNFLRAYENATLVVADGKPVVLASRLLGKPLPEVIPGSDLVPALFSKAVRDKKSLRVFLLGAGAGVAERASAEIESKWGSAVTVVGVFSPALGFENKAEECREIIEKINYSAPDVLVLGLGAPKQELWISKNSPLIKAGVALCVGATIDFLAGEKKRAPVWVRNLALEWVYRVLQEPRRLAGRYAYDLIVFPGMFIVEYFKNSRK
jgi:N-acetylglucosaminyldiphosphoundecaprenol N-acetyl-beta-D-mannosaminyltransferase